MSKNDLDKVLANAKNIPTVENLLPKAEKKKKHTLLSKAIRKKPKKKKVEDPTTLQENFLKQIENYNDFIIQNDLEDEQIDPSNEYDFSAFTSPEDWAVESERLADRLSDRKIEIKQNEDAGEFAEMELENGVPSYEAVKNMTKAEFKKYEDKYLSDTFKKIDEQIKVDEARPEFTDELKEEIIRQDHQRNGEETQISAPTQKTEPVAEETNTSSEKDAVKKVPESKVDKVTVPSKPVPLDLKSLVKNSLPYPVKSALDSALEAVQSANKVVDQGQLLNAVEDAGRGVMGGLADTAGSIADLGGLVPNRIADTAHDSADWWNDQYEIPDSEAGRIGSNIGNEAVAGLAGGIVGKVAGTAYKGMKLGGEALRKRATVAAKDAEKMVISNPTLKNKLRHQTQLVKQNSYENLTNKSPYKSFNSNKSLGSVLTNNVKRNFDDRAMLQRNNVELNRLFNQGNTLDDALRLRQNQWDQIPNTARDAGLMLGVSQ